MTENFQIGSMSQEQIKDLGSSKQPGPKTRSGKRIDLDDRTYPTWFRLYHSLDNCSYCPERRMTATLDGIHRICRHCFLDSKDKESNEVGPDGS